jgi:hypothetical protein
MSESEGRASRQTTSKSATRSRAAHTCWVLIRAAANGEESAPEAFVRR